MVSKSFLEVMTTVWGSPEECPLFSLHILTHQCHGFPCMRIQFSNSGIVLIFMKDTSALSKNNLFRLDDCKAHLHLHCFISFITYLALFRSAILYFDWIVSEVFFSVHILVYFWGMCIYAVYGDIQVYIWVFAFDSTCRGQYLTLGCLSQSSKIYCYYYY